MGLALSTKSEEVRAGGLCGRRRTTVTAALSRLIPTLPSWRRRTLLELPHLLHPHQLAAQPHEPPRRMQRCCLACSMVHR
jgi:hypothetical protein